MTGRHNAGDVGLDQYAKARGKERQPADLVHGDLFYLIVQFEAIFCRTGEGVGFFADLVKLWVGPMPIVVGRIAAQLLRDKVLWGWVIRPPDAQIELQTLIRRQIGRVQILAKGCQF